MARDGWHFGGEKRKLRSYDITDQINNVLTNSIVYNINSNILYAEYELKI